MTREIQIERARELYHYDPVAGVFIAKTKTGRRKIGEIAGSLAPKRKWTSTRYKLISIDGEQFLAHRVAWAMYYSEQPPELLDHIDTNGANNSISNLRVADGTENGANCSKRSHNKSGFKGVSFCQATGRWRASISFRKMSINLGRYPTKEAASSAYEAASKVLFGEFAKT